METLDGEQLENCVVDIDYKNGYSFGSALRITIGILGFFGAVALFSGGNGIIIGPILVVISIYILTSTYGTQVSIENKYVKNYTASFGIKKGKWISTHLLPDISILKMGNPVSFNQAYGTNSIQIDNHVYEIHLLSKNHRKRILLRTRATYADAFIVAEELSNILEKNLVPFNPVLSQATLQKRYKRH